MNPYVPDLGDHMTLTIQLPEKLEAALKAQANAQGVSAAEYVREIVERDIAAAATEGASSGVAFKTDRGVLAKYGSAPSAEEIDANRIAMFQHFAEA